MNKKMLTVAIISSTLALSSGASHAYTASGTTLTVKGACGSSMGSGFASAKDLTGAVAAITGSINTAIATATQQINNKNRENAETVSNSTTNGSKMEANANAQIAKDSIRAKRKMEAHDKFLSDASRTKAGCNGVSRSVEQSKGNLGVKNHKKGLTKVAGQLIKGPKPGSISQQYKNHFDMLDGPGLSIEDEGMAVLNNNVLTEEQEAAIIKRTATIFNPNPRVQLTEAEKESIGKPYTAIERQKEDHEKIFTQAIMKRAANAKPLYDPEPYLDLIPDTEEFEEMRVRIWNGGLLTKRDVREVKSAYYNSPERIAEREAKDNQMALMKERNQLLSLQVEQNFEMLNSIESLELMYSLAEGPAVSKSYEARLKALHPDSKGMKN